MGDRLNHLYARSPVSLQNMAVSLYGWTWKKRRYGGIFESELRGFKDREGYTRGQWRNYQTACLRRLLAHAFETVPYYRRIYAEAGFSQHDFSRFEIEDLKLLPYLEKEEVRRFCRTELLSDRREPGGRFFASSGSTGTPTSILYSHAFHQKWSAAFEARIRHWAGLNKDVPRGMIGGRRVVASAESPPPYYRYNRFEKQTYFSAYHISKSAAPNYLEGMREHDVEYMTGYAVSNFLLARMFDDLTLQAPELRAVVVSSEKLTTEMRNMFKKVYGCRTFDSYSGVEACGLISENSAGELVVSPDVAIVEFLDAHGKEVAPDEEGELVCTGLLNFDQPLIRYRIGDVARLSKKKTSELGLEMPIVEEISGRIEDVVTGPDGREMVRFHGIFIDLAGLLAAQVVQEKVDWIHVNAITDSRFGKAEERTIEERIRSQLGDVHVTVERVKELARNSSGKTPAVISKCRQE